MTFSEPVRARMAVDQVMLALFRLFSSSVPVRVLALAALEECRQALAQDPKGPCFLLSVLDALRAALEQDMQKDTTIPVDWSTTPGKDELPN